MSVRRHNCRSDRRRHIVFRRGSISKFRISTPTDKRRGIGNARHLTDTRRHVAKCETDSPVVRMVRRGGVCNVHVMKGNFAGRHDDIQCLRFVHLLFHNLAARQKIVFVERIFVVIQSARCEPGIIFMQPLSMVDGESASQAVTTS